MKLKRLILILLVSIPAIADAHDRIFKGQYFYGNEVSIFVECDSDKKYWLQGSGFLLSDIWQLILRNKEYEPIYIEFRGHEHFEEVDGYQASYDHQLHLSEVLTHNVLIPKQCK